MKLAPPIAPGRTNRRARAFADEIARLRDEGYSHVAIQRALAMAGVNVSKSTVRREVARLTAHPTPHAPARFVTRPLHQAPPKQAVLDASTSHRARPDPLLNQQGSPREIAEAFIKSQITNPLFKNRS